MTNKTTLYDVIEDDQLKTFVSRVTIALSKGWKLHGPMTTYVAEINHSYYTQAMTRKVK